MHRIQITVILLFCIIFLNGCIPLIPKGSKLGQEFTVAVRTNSTGQTTEKIVAVPTEKHYFVIWGAEGGKDDYVGSRTWRFYLQDQDGKRKTLPFLKTKAEWVFSPWVLVEPFPHTNLWIAVIFEGDMIVREKSDYRVLCFNSSKLVYAHVIAGAGDMTFSTSTSDSKVTRYYLPNSQVPKFRFDPVGNMLFYNNGSTEVKFDLMSKKNDSN